MGHCCQPKQFLLLLVDESGDPTHEVNPNDTVLEPDTSLTEERSAEVIHFQLSDNALQGKPSPRTFKFFGSIHGHSVVVLVDIGSFHNVIPPCLA